MLADFYYLCKNHIMKDIESLTDLRKKHHLRPMKELDEEQQELVFVIQVLEFEYINNDLTEEESLKKLKDINKAYEEGIALKIFQ